MEKSKRFTDLIVWQKAHQLVLLVYKITKDFPREELYGLISQMRRAAISVPANIAEGYKKKGKRDKIRFLNIAHGSLEESHYYLLLAKDLNYVSDVDELLNLKDEVGKLLNAYSKSILTSIS